MSSELQQVDAEWWKGEWQIGVTPDVIDDIRFDGPQHLGDALRGALEKWSRGEDFDSEVFGKLSAWMRETGAAADGPAAIAEWEAVQNSDYWAGDRMSFWRFDPERGHLLVRFPLNETTISRTEGAWIETGFRLGTDGSLVELPDVHIHNFDGDRARRSDLLQKLGLDAVNKQLRRHVRIVARRLNLGDAWEQATVRVGRHGAKGRSDMELAQWAQRFSEAYATDPKRPYKVLKSRYDYSESALRSIIRKVRQTGLLEPASAGKTACEMTPKSKRLLGLEEE